MDTDGREARQSRRSAHNGNVLPAGPRRTQNYILAYMWFSVAAHDPDYQEVIRNDLAGLEPNLAPSQIAEAKAWLSVA